MEIVEQAVAYTNRILGRLTSGLAKRDEAGKVIVTVVDESSEVEV
jgi:hypothetical protein